MNCGVVDVGSNTIRLSIYRVEAGGFRLLLNKKEMAGLAGYVEHGAISRAGMEVACRALQDFRALLDNFDIENMYSFATASLRNISNTEEALDYIEERIGLRVDVLSGADEAKLSFYGAAHAGGQSRGLLADIGGGSTELVAYRDGEISSGCSLPLGSLSLYSRFVDDLFPDKDSRRKMEHYVETELQKAKTKGLTCKHLTGVGGTIRAAGKLYNALSGEDPSNTHLPAEGVHELYKHLRKGEKTELRQFLRTCPERVHTILPGLCILSIILSAYRVESITVSSAGVREGYLLERVIKERRDEDAS